MYKRKKLLIFFIFIIAVLTPILAYSGEFIISELLIDEISYLNSEEKVTIEDYNSMVEHVEGKDYEYNQEPTLSGYGNIVISDWKRKKIGTFDFNAESMMDWVWSDLDTNSEWLYEDYNIWDGSRLKYDETIDSYKTNRYYTSKLFSGDKITADYFEDGSKLYDSATWIFEGNADELNTTYTLNRIQGSFKIKGSPVGHDYTLSSVTPTGNLYIDDDMFVFIYPKGTELVDDPSDVNYFINYLCFWGGTTTFSDFHGIKQLEAASIIKDDQYMGLAGNYSMKVVNDNIGDKIDYAYALNPWNLEKEFVIDIITSERCGGGGVYRPKIVATPSASTEDNVDLVFKVVSSSDSNVLVNGAAFKMDYRQTWYPVGVSISQIYNTENGYFENTGGNMLISVHPSVLNDKTTDDTEDYYMHTLHQIMDAPGYYSTEETWEIYVPIDSDGDRSYVVNGIHGKVENDAKVYWEGSNPSMPPLEIALTPIDYIISFDMNGGVVDNNSYTTTYNIEQNVVLPYPTLEDYTFVGWKVTTSDGSWKMDSIFNSGDIGNGNYGNVTLKAEWIRNNLYTIFIPDQIILDTNGKGEIGIDILVEYLSDTAEVEIYVNELSKLKLEDIDELVDIEYELVNLQNGNTINVNDVAVSFSKEDVDSKRLDINLKDEPIYSGLYSGKINFFIELNK